MFPWSPEDWDHEGLGEKERGKGGAAGKVKGKGRGRLKGLQEKKREKGEGEGRKGGGRLLGLWEGKGGKGKGRGAAVRVVGGGGGKGEKGVERLWGLGYLVLGLEFSFYTFFFRFNETGSVWSGSIDLSFFKPEPNQTGQFFYFLIGLFGFFFGSVFSLNFFLVFSV